MGFSGKTKKSLEKGSTKIRGALGECPVVAPEPLHLSGSEPKPTPGDVVMTLLGVSRALGGLGRKTKPGINPQESDGFNHHSKHKGRSSWH